MPQTPRQSRTYNAATPTAMTATVNNPAKRKREAPSSSASRTTATTTTKRARTSTGTSPSSSRAVTTQATEVIDLTSSTPSPRSTPKKRKRASSSAVPTVRSPEKRLRAFRKWAPQSYLVKLERARTQRLFVLGRQREETEEGPEEVVDIVGSTGNVYQVVIGKMPTCTCPDNMKGNQCKHIVYVLTNVLKAPYDLQYQLAFLSSELREIFDHAPRSPTENASKSDAEGNRKEISGDCPICFMEFEPDKEEIVWCKAACGNNIHKTCFQQWVTSQRGKACCVYCRTPWEHEKPNGKDVLRQGYVNEEGYLNVGESMGLPEERDYSTYHYSPYSSRWRSRYSYY